MEAASRRRALVTGASSGIGRELALVLARDGCDLILVARRRDRLELIAAEIRDEYRVDVTVEACDLTDRTAVTNLVERLAAHPRAIDILVNNAGFGSMSRFVDDDYAVLDTMLELNIRALTYLTHRFAPGMAARGRGWILNVASTGAFQPGPGMATYHATKAYVIFLSEALHEELRPWGVVVTALCPGFTESEFHDVASVQRGRGLNRMMADPAVVAAVGYRGMMRGRAVVVPIFRDRVLAVASGLAPRWLARKVAGRILALGSNRSNS